MEVIGSFFFGSNGVDDVDDEAAGLEELFTGNSVGSGLPSTRAFSFNLYNAATELSYFSLAGASMATLPSCFR